MEKKVNKIYGTKSMTGYALASVGVPLAAAS
jgi:hypothetical protein